MKNQLQLIHISNFTTTSGYDLNDLPLSYQLFGKELGSSPIVLVNHALTGNSNVAGETGWWNSIIGEGKVIDTNRYTILSFNIPGNGYDGFVIDNYEDFVARDVAEIFIAGLKILGISKLFAIIGGSLGGGIAWEMAVLQPKLAEHLIPVATDWKATDWLIANCHIQQQFLLNSKNPVNDARMHAMLCYRTPVSFNERFNRTKNDELQVFNVQSWLMHHGKKLQERFQLSAYKLMNQLLATIDVTKGREEGMQVLDAIQSHIHIIGVDSDMFFSAEENRKTHKQLALSNPNITYHEIHSDHGHDAFLIEFDQLEHILLPIFKPEIASEHIKVLKFGGKSLANGDGINQVVSIIKSKHELNEKLVVVVSARGGTTDDLLRLIQLAEKGENYQEALHLLIKNQILDGVSYDFSKEKETIERLLKGVEALGYCTPRTRDEILAQGELFSIKAISSLLNLKGIVAKAIDSRDIIKTNSEFGEAQPIQAISKDLTVKAIKNGPSDVVYVVSGFIGSDQDGITTTLGRNGSNYTAALLANYLEADELQNFTHVDGIFTANPEVVKNAKKINQLTYDEANEIAHFGAEILHAKTIIPLIEKNINLRILNTYNPDDNGTLITAEGNGKGMKSISTISNRALVQIEGRGLMGKAGIDERIFRALGQKGINVSIISQGSSERGIGVVVAAIESEKAQKALKHEFSKELEDNDVNKIAVLDGVAVVSLIGQDLSSFHRPYSALVKNEIVPILFNNTVTGKNVSIVVKEKDVKKAVNVIHGELFGVAKVINLVIFGKGTVGNVLIDQIISSAKDIETRKNIDLKIIGVTSSKKMYLSDAGLTENWSQQFDGNYEQFSLDNIISYCKQNHLVNLVAVDVTSGSEFSNQYEKLIENGFNIISANKVANTKSLKFYQHLRESLKKHKKNFLYETNVGAGLPLIDTIRLLHLSGENITRIRGVFSGTLSYLFNRYSIENQPFSAILNDAIKLGLTEPDPRDDLGGVDVARKLLILARELDLHNEMEDVVIEDLIPEDIKALNKVEFLDSLSQLDSVFEDRKSILASNQVLRYVGDLSGDLSLDDGANLEVKLIAIEKDTPLGSLRNADSIFEIYTESYGEQPLVIQGAGAGAKVTARGVFGDILKLAEKAD